jgi:hypothetical protein
LTESEGKILKALASLHEVAEPVLARFRSEEVIVLLERQGMAVPVPLDLHGSERGPRGPVLAAAIALAMPAQAQTSLIRCPGKPDLVLVELVTHELVGHTVLEYLPQGRGGDLRLLERVDRRQLIARDRFFAARGPLFIRQATPLLSSIFSGRALLERLALSTADAEIRRLAEALPSHAIGLAGPSAGDPGARVLH